MVQIDEYDVLDEYSLKIENINEQIRFNNRIIKRLNQRNTDLRYKIKGIEEDIRTFKEQQKL